MTFNLQDLPENFYFKHLRCNSYDPMIRHDIGVVDIFDPKTLAFLSSKEMFNWELEVIEPIRNESGKITGLTPPVTKAFKVQGLGIPTVGILDGAIEATFVETMVSNTVADYQGAFGKYWTNYFLINVHDEFSGYRTVTVESNSLGGLQPVPGSWPSPIWGQLLDIAVYVR
mgnify:CR=1 FL=1